MALTNFSLPFGALAQPWGAATLSPLHSIHQLASNTNNLLYSPVEHQQQDGDARPPPPGSEYFKNNPYAPPQQQHVHHLHHQQQQQQPPSPSQQQTYQYNANSNNKSRRTSGNTYLPPIPPPGVARQSVYQQQQQQQQQHQQQYDHHYNTQQQQQQEQQEVHNNNNNVVYKSETSAAAASASASSASSSASSRTYGESTYSRLPTSSQSTATKLPLPQQQQQQQQQRQPAQPQHQQQYFNSYSSTQRATSTASVASSATFNSNKPQQQQQQQLAQPTLRQHFGAKVETPATTYGAAPAPASAPTTKTTTELPNDFPERPPGFTRVQAGQGSRTQVHAVLDYDVEEGEEAEDYYDAEDQGEVVNKDDRKSPMPTVTPIQGPIFLKNGSVPVVPLFSYPTLNNGSFVQIPIWWTALSLALGLDVRGDIIKGVPCIKRYHQLFCPTAGNSYPIDKIERFIDDNKALMRRMYGDFEMNMDTGGPRQQLKQRKRRFIDEPDIFMPPGVSPADAYEHTRMEAGDSYFGNLRKKRQTSNGNQNRSGGNRSGPSSAGNPGSTGNSGTGRLDACESKIEIVTPYWASNSAGKIRAIVNTQHFEQAIHQEVCSKTQTSRCEGECGCEQKYKWHRLLAYDPDNDCKGIFMDWFLFPSCCVCRCNPR